MSSEFEIWFLPNNLRAVSEKVATLLRSINFDVLYLNVPRELDWLVNELSLGAPYEQFIEEVECLNVLRGSIKTWEYRFKPILLAIRGLKFRKPSSKIICYENSALENLSIKFAEEIATLILRVNITGRVDVDEWHRILSEIIINVSKSIDDESNYILETWMEGNRGRKTICISDYPAKGILRKIRELGAKTILRYIFTPYYFTPLEVLIREFIIASERGLNISNKRIENLVKIHAGFIRDYVLISNDYDEAYFRWLRNGHYKKYYQEMR
ncbi:MAG: hypothetical protein QXH24_06930 [Candidatus Bathyarchaeia archaeon]